MEISLLKIFLCLLISVLLTFAYTCQTPTEWLDQNYQRNSSRRGKRGVSELSGELWPDGIVKYKIHPNLTNEDKVEVFAAFEEYHRKTCIRFEPANETDIAFVNIEVDDTVCGNSRTCRQGTYQFVRFGGDCKTMNTMIHQLGHTLCLQHEHQRADRDLYIRYDEECEQESYPGIMKLSSSHKKGFYDYASQMHSECGNCYGGWPIKENVTACGPRRTAGLSVLDADYINELYNCQGRFRHRWVPIESLTPTHKNNMNSFGFKDIDEIDLYPCRGFFQGHLIIGSHRWNSGSCLISFLGSESTLREKFEVLTLSPRRRLEVFEFALEEINSDTSTKKKLEIFKSAVVAGYLPWADGSGIGNGYIGYTKLQLLPYGSTCPFDSNRSVFQEIGVIGKIWHYSNTSEIYLEASYKNKEFAFQNYYVLTYTNVLNGCLKPEIFYNFL